MNTVTGLVRRLAKPRVLVHAYAARSSSTQGLLPELIVPAQKDMIICWHPERTVPYEYTQPLPVELPDPKEEKTVLRVGEKDIRKMFHKPQDGNLMAIELGKLTYTCKHRWFPTSRIRKAKKTPPNRPYL